MRTITSLAFCFCIAILPGCSSFWGSQHETAIIDIDKELVDSGWYAPPPPYLHWTNPTSLAIYRRLAEAIVSEKTPDLSGFSEEQVNNAYTAIFESQTSHSSRIHYGWFALFDDLIQKFSDRDACLHMGYDDDPLFEKYRGREWKVSYTFLKIRRRFEDGTEKVSGVVISAPEPPEELKPTEVQAQ